MKHTVPLLAAVLLLAACSNDQEQIKQSAYGYLDAMGNYRPTEARAYSTPQTCDITLAFFENILKHTDSSVYRNNIPAEITIGEITVADDTTATAAFHKSTPSMQQDGTVHLVKRQGHWLVHEVLNVPKLPTDDQQPTVLPEEDIKALHEKYGKKK